MDYDAFLEKEGLVAHKRRELTSEERTWCARMKIPYKGMKICWTEKKPIDQWTASQLQKGMEILSREVEEKIGECENLRQKLLETEDLKTAKKLRDEIRFVGRAIALKEKEMEKLDAELRKRQVAGFLSFQA